MFDQRFLDSKVGAAAMVSIAAMVVFNIFALSYQLDPQIGKTMVNAAVHPVELA